MQRLCDAIRLDVQQWASTEVDDVDELENKVPSIFEWDYSL